MRVERDGWSVKTAKAKRGEVPEWFEEEPLAPPGCDMFEIAYRDLATERADGPIPWRAAMAYVDRKGMDPDVGDALWDVIRMMDMAERRWYLDEMKAGTSDG